MVIKKLLLTLFFISSVVLGLTQNSKEKGNSEIFNGIRLGSGISTIHSQKGGEQFIYKPNYFAGIYYEFGELFFIYQFEILYQNTGATKEIDSWKLNLNYLTLNVAAKKQILNEFKINILFGTYASILINKKFNSDIQVENYIENGVKSLDFGFILGLEKQIFQIKKNLVLIGIRFNYGIYDFYDNKPSYISSIDSKWDRNISINIGLQIKLH